MKTLQKRSPGMRFIMTVLSLVNLGLCSQPGSAQNAATDDSKEAEPTMLLLTVDKGTLQAELQTLVSPSESPERLHSFRIAIGRAAGDKQREGDNRTPEGVYFPLQHIITEKFLPAKYGPRSIPLDFPNAMDRRDGKTGHGIWLHGAGDDNRIASAQVTEGCVAFYNADITKLQSWLQPNQGVVVIAQDVALTVNRPEDIHAVHGATQAWMEAWAKRQDEAYISHYHTDFNTGGRDRRAYHRYKKQVFASYKAIDLGITNLRVITHPKYAVSIMNQDFRGDERFRSRGRKVLYWERDAKGWKIVRELFDQKRFAPLLYSKADVSKLKAVTAAATPFRSSKTR